MGNTSRWKLHKTALALLITGMLFIGTSMAGASVFTLPNFKQERSNWCWAASSLMIINYLTGSKPSQCSVVKKGKASTSCPNEPGSFGRDIQRALDAYGITDGWRVGGPTAESVARTLIDQKRPIMVRYGYHSSGKRTGHVVVLRGYTWNPGGKYYTYSWNDPASGTIKSGRYTYLVNNSTWQWTHSRTGMGRQK